MSRKKPSAPPAKPVTAEDVLRRATGPDGCHANTNETLAVCRQLGAQGLVREGPFKNVNDRPVFFAD